MATTGDLNAKFLKAADFFRSYPKGGKIILSNDQQLKFYSLFKVATIGKCNIQDPGSSDMTARAKWNAWNGQGDKQQNEAKTEYIQSLVLLLNQYERNAEEIALLNEIAI